MHGNNFLYQFKLKFEICVTKYSHRAEKIRHDKGVYTQQHNFITFNTIDVRVVELKIVWMSEVQASMPSAEDAYPPPHCPTQLALSPLAPQLSPLQWYMAWNGVSPI